MKPTIFRRLAASSALRIPALTRSSKLLALSVGMPAFADLIVWFARSIACSQARVTFRIAASCQVQFSRNPSPAAARSCLARATHRWMLWALLMTTSLFRAVYSHVADQLAIPLDATPPGSYHQRGASSLQRLFRAHFTELVTRYEDEFAKRLGKFRLERITKAVEPFLGCGGYRRGVARIQCTNPDCRAEYFRPFSCSVFHLCPSCSQKRTLLLGEYMNEQLLLRLPHRQFVFTLPKVLRVFFRHDKRLHGEISRLIYALVRDFTTEAAQASGEPHPGRGRREVAVRGDQVFDDANGASWM